MNHPIAFDTRLVYIAGAWRAGDDGRTLPLHNPSDGTLLAHIARGNAADVDAAVNAARAALDGAWGTLTATERAAASNCPLVASSTRGMGVRRASRRCTAFRRSRRWPSSTIEWQADLSYTDIRLNRKEPPCVSTPALMKPPNSSWST